MDSMARRSSRIQSRQCSTSLPHVLGSFYEGQSTPKQRTRDSQAPQPSRATSYTRLPSSGPTEVSGLLTSRAQLQKYRTRKWGPDKSIKTCTEKPLIRACLTEKNLKALGKIGRRGTKSAGKFSSKKSSSKSTINKDFGPQLQRNNVVFNNIDTRVADDNDEVRESLNRIRESEPPDHLAYKRYLVTTQGYKNEATIQHSAYPLLTKRTSAEKEISGYTQSVNYAWSAVNNHLTSGLSDTKPDVFESYRKTDYPPEAVDALSSALAPTLYDIAMPAFAVENKGYDGSMAEAQLQCAYDGALMTKEAHARHSYTNEPDDDFYGKTKALTVAYNGDTVKFYGHHAIKIPIPSGPTRSRVDSSTDTNSDGLAYHQYVLSSDNPLDSFENFQSAYKHARNAQDIGYLWATQRKDDLWAYVNADNTQASSDVPASQLQSSNDPGAPTSSGAPVGHSFGASDDRADPNDQSRGEHGTSLAANNQNSPLRIPTVEDGCASPNALSYTPISPPRSSKDVALPLKSQQLSARPVRSLVKMYALTRRVIEEITEQGHERLTLRKDRGRLIINLQGERLVDNIRDNK